MKAKQAIRVAACLLSSYAVCGCRPVSKPQPYSLVDIEMKMESWMSNRGKRYDYAATAMRFRYAGPAVLPELSRALEAKEGRFMARAALRPFTEQDKWPEAYAFIEERFKRGPSSEEAGCLIYAVAHKGLAEHPELIPYVARYLDDETYVLHRFLQDPENKHKILVRDLACLALQEASGEDWGVGPTWVASPEAIVKAKAWIKRNNSGRRQGRNPGNVGLNMT